jgi:hypothetical protein
MLGEKEKKFKKTLDKCLRLCYNKYRKKTKREVNENGYI